MEKNYTVPVSSADSGIIVKIKPIFYSQNHNLRVRCNGPQTYGEVRWAVKDDTLHARARAQLRLGTGQSRPPTRAQNKNTAKDRMAQLR